MLLSYLCFLKKKQYYFFQTEMFIMLIIINVRINTYKFYILGGKFDATNIIDSTLAIITSIGIDHTEFGYTIYQQCAYTIVSSN